MGKPRSRCASCLDRPHLPSDEELADVDTDHLWQRLQDRWWGLIRTLADRGVGKKAIAREVGVAVNTVRRYLRDPIMPGSRSARRRGG